MIENDLIVVGLMLVASIHPWAMDYAPVQNYNTVAVVVLVAAAVEVGAAVAALPVVPPNESGLNNWLVDVRAMNFLASPHNCDPNH